VEGALLEVGTTSTEGLPGGRTHPRGECRRLQALVQPARPDKLNYRHERLSKAPASAAEDRPALRSEVVELLARLYQWRSDADRAHRAQENLRVVFYSSLVGLSEPNTLNFAERLMTGGGPV
jgi:hypothetical protein